MPRAKASNKKGQTKAADAKDLNNVQEKSLGNGDGDELKTDFSSLKNGSVKDDELKAKEVQAPKRSGRGKKEEKVVLTEEEEEVPKKKPVTKGRGKKLENENENEVIENEIDSPTDNTDAAESVNKEETTVTKSKGRGRKAATTTKKTTEPEEVEATTLLVKEKNLIENSFDDVKNSENKSKVAGGGGKKKKQEEKKDENAVENENGSEPTAEKAKKSTRNSKKVLDYLEESLKEEPPKKRGKASKKEASVEKDFAALKSEETEETEQPSKKKGRGSKKDLAVEKIVEMPHKTEETLEDKTETSEKKPIKRGRAAAKLAAKADDLEEITNNEELLPKKRSRKAPIVEQEIVEEKPTRGGRGRKKAEKPDDAKILEPEEELETDGQEKMENIEEIEEKVNNKKKAAKKPVKTTAAAARTGRKRAAPSTNKQITAVDDDDNEENENEMEDDEADGSKPSKTKKTKTTAAPINATTTLYNKADFDLKALPAGQTADEPRFNFKISSWNVAGLRSWLKKDGLKFLEYEEPDIFCMQETKCTTDQLPEEVVRIPGYHPYWLCMPGGHAGVAIYSKIMPINVEYGIGNKEFDDSGRIITAEYEKFFLVNVYVPNSGRKLVNLETRMKWEKLFQEFLGKLNARKAVVVCGDMNVSHLQIDLANPKTNTRNAGFTKEEREKMTELLSLGYIDTFRHLYPDRIGAYTFWTYMGNARSRNVGWRLDYFLVSERFIKRVVDNCIRSQCMGSDHCPITLFLKL